MNSSSLKARHRRDFAELTRSGYGRAVWIALAAVLAFVAGTAYYMSTLEGDTQSLYRLARTNSDVRSFVYQAETFSSWSSRFAFGFEERFYNSVKDKMFLSVERLSGEEPRVWLLSLHRGVLQIVFFLVASWKLWLLTALGVVVYQRRVLTPAKGDDFVANTGNGRVYYSGIRVGLDSIDSDGTMNRQLTGLACPQMASVKAVESSDLFKVCNHYGALNDTNADLIAVILAYADYPAFMPESSDFLKLPDFALATIKVAFTLKQSFQGSSLEEEIDTTKIESQAPALLAESVGDLGAKYSDQLSTSFERVLLKEMKRVIADMNATELATLILSAAAGRALVYSFEHGGWSSHSQYPELSARAVLFSIPSFDRDYNHHERVRLRQALMYAQRTTAFGPVRFSETMGIDIQALRQWSELLFTEPERLESVTNEIELYSISWYYFWKFHAAFNRELEKQDGTLPSQVVMTEGGLGFVPLSSLLPVLRSVTPRVIRKRLVELSELVSATQEHIAKADASETRPDYERVFRPLSNEQVSELAELHEVKPHDIEEWAAFRALLNLYGSLVRKVGFSVVPEHSLVGSVAIDENGYTHSRLGDVALRVGHLVESDSFLPGIRAVRIKIALTMDEYNQKVRGDSPSQEVTNG